MSTAPDNKLDLRGTSSLALMHRLRDVKDTRLGPAHRAVLYAVVTFRGGDEEVAWRASVGQLADAVGLSTKHARRVIHELEDLGYLSSSGRDAENVGRMVAYSLILPSARDPSHQREPSPARETSLGREAAPPEGGSGPLPPTGVSADLSADLSADPSGGPPSALVVRPAFRSTSPRMRPKQPREAGTATPMRPNPPGVNDVLGAFRAAFKTKYGSDPVGLGAAPAIKLLKAVNGNVDDAVARVRRAIAEGVTELHHVANQPNRYGGAAQLSPTARKSDVRAIAQDGISSDLRLQGFG